MSMGTTYPKITEVYSENNIDGPQRQRAVNNSQSPLQLRHPEKHAL